MTIEKETQLSINKRFTEILEHLLFTKRVKSKVEFSEKIGIKSQNLNRYLEGTSPVTINMIIRLCNQFDASYEYVIEGTGNMYKNSEQNVNVGQGVGSMQGSGNVFQKNLQGEKSKDLNVSDIILEEYYFLKRRVEELNSELFKCQSKVIELLEAKR